MNAWVAEYYWLFYATDFLFRSAMYVVMVSLLFKICKRLGRD